MTTEPLTKLIVNCETGEQTIVPLTEEEIADLEVQRLAAEARQAEYKAAEEERAILKASAKAKLIAGEPLTEEEAATLII